MAGQPRVYGTRRPRLAAAVQRVTAAALQLPTKRPRSAPLPVCRLLQANGQRARLTPEVGQAVLDTLDAAEAALPAAQEVKSLLPFF